MRPSTQLVRSRGQRADSPGPAKLPMCKLPVARMRTTGLIGLALVSHSPWLRAETIVPVRSVDSMAA
jgi:hypothetical protein